MFQASHSYILPLQTRHIYGRCFWPSLTHQGYYGEQGTYTAPAQECAESQSQETTKIREGEEENFVSESCLQRWYLRQWTIRWRKDWYIQGRQEYSFGMTRDVSYISPFVKPCKFHFGLAKTFKIIRVRQPKSFTYMDESNRLQNYHFPLRIALLACRVFLPLAPLTD